MSYERLEKACKGRVLRNEPLAAHTSFRIGGPADCFVWAEDMEDVQIALDTAHGEGWPLMMIGHGTNMLVADDGVRGLVLCLGHGFETLTREGTQLRAGGALGLPRLLDYCAEAGLGGLEFAAGIPGTLGGALYTDANTKTGWVRQVLTGITVAEAKTGIREMDAGACAPEKQAGIGDGCLVEACLQLTEADPDDIRHEVGRYLHRRRETQPIDKASAGCIFVNPPDQPAGKLIDESGCKGMAVGGARVSDLHANFIINTGGARCKDVLDLMDKVKERVYQATGIDLEPEINIVGTVG
jgi:UDP-N-acetylmuramate dehydrogenase